MKTIYDLALEYSRKYGKSLEYSMIKIQKLNEMRKNKDLRRRLKIGKIK